MPTDPMWCFENYGEAAEYIDQLEKQRDELLAALNILVSDIQDLIGESHGVVGLHLNGDIAPWGELEPGGQYERLAGMLIAIEAISKVEEQS